VLPEVELSPCLISSSLDSLGVELSPSLSLLVISGVDLDEDAMPDCQVTFMAWRYANLTL
jgi:hypothetical protein